MPEERLSGLNAEFYNNLLELKAKIKIFKTV